MGDANILLPVEELAKALHVEPRSISRYRRWCQEDGLLRQVKQHSYTGKRGEGRATEFRFDVSRVPLLMQKAQRGTLDSFRRAAGGSEN